MSHSPIHSLTFCVHSFIRGRPLEKWWVGGGTWKKVKHKKLIEKIHKVKSKKKKVKKQHSCKDGNNSYITRRTKKKKKKKKQQQQQQQQQKFVQDKNSLPSLLPPASITFQRPLVDIYGCVKNLGFLCCLPIILYSICHMRKVRIVRQERWLQYKEIHRFLSLLWRILSVVTRPIMDWHM